MDIRKRISGMFLVLIEEVQPNTIKIWRIWPAILLHTLFASAITVLSIRGIVHLEIPNIMLTVLGVVIGFVISYRATSGYERYWLGRGYWSDITPEEVQAGQQQRTVKEMKKVMAEKSMALDLVYGFSLAVKHHLRGETGIYYEDLYHLVRPLHDHEHTADNERRHNTSTDLLSPRRGHRITTQVSAAQSGIPITAVPPLVASTSKDSYQPPAAERPIPDPMVPPINAYGTFDPSTLTNRSVPSTSQRPRERSASPASHFSSISSINQPLLPSTQPPNQDMMNKVSRDLIPFAGLMTSIKRVLGFQGPEEASGEHVGDEDDDFNDAYVAKRRWQGPVQSGLHMKHHPKVAGDGENLPLEIVRCLSEWFSVLEDRGTVPGTSMGTMVATLASFEDSLTGLERILTTPLPFVYSVHISTVWLYLFFLPFQLVNQFAYYTIPGVAIAAFIYLGFVAAGEEIEQPFGYDDNDLDLDLFCKSIIGLDINHLKTSPALNSYLGPLQEDPQVLHRRSLTLNEITSSTAVDDIEDAETTASPVSAP
ncbi:Bestrophin, RFP-TM, chloride channel-domain-containing protein [Ephemerocybe angulata]|uniref:Bestrophin, RFP-TM, chloride channel-domain-containing protein n=1 Tax=Ephemerocybe angulata TaxID=980116 RepID=A0A8H6LZI0_9AGAR|nr:Bestrophin, RFP-TM, chloride channel-domain-containing protein [Tulosesus angulatus]